MQWNNGICIIKLIERPNQQEVDRKEHKVKRPVPESPVVDEVCVELKSDSCQIKELFVSNVVVFVSLMKAK